MNKLKSRHNDSVLRIPLERKQWVLLLTEIDAPKVLMKRIQFAQVVEDHFNMSLKKEQWDELIGCIEIQVNRSRKPRIQKELRTLLDYLRQFLPQNVIDINVYRGQQKGLDQTGEQANMAFSDEFTDPDFSMDEEMFSSIENDHPVLPPGLEEALLMSLDPHAWIANSEVSGLTWDQLKQILDSDWDNDLGTIKFNKSLNLKELQASFILENARIILREVASCSGVKATVTGRFNRKFVSHILTLMKMPDDFLEDPYYLNKVLNEQDVFYLHIIRTILDISRLMALKKGVLVVTKKGERLLKDDRAGQLFHLLFKTFFTGFNLAYLDQMAETQGLQETIAYSLFMVSKMDMKWGREDELTTFLLLPPVMLEMRETITEPSYYFFSRFLRPLINFGLMESRTVDLHKSRYGELEIRKTPLFDKFISFRMNCEC